MSLIGSELANKLQTELTPIKTEAGGSSANTLVNMEMLGGETVFFGVTTNDSIGHKFNNSLKARGVEVTNPAKAMEEGSGQSFILVTPDGERTMLTHIGSSDNFSPTDINYSTLESTKIFYTQAYVVDEKLTTPMLKQAFTTVRNSGGLNAFSLSSVFMVKQHKKSIQTLLPSIDVIFGNQEEFAELYGTPKLPDIIAKAKLNNKVNIVTLGKKGAIIILNNNVIPVPAVKVKKVVDTTGAGDAFAGGFLYAYAKGYDLATAGRYGSFMASLVITELGGRLPNDEKNISAIKTFINPSP